MEQFRRIGEVLGSIKALITLQDDVQINRRQCLLLNDMFTLAFDTIAEEIRHNLKLEEKNTNWKVLEQPLEELYRIFKEGELYIKHCMNCKDWLGKLISLHQNKDCVELHIHNLLCYFPAVIEAIENAGLISGFDSEEMQKRQVFLSRKYDREWSDLKLFQWRFGKQYLITREICSRLENAWKEDRWFLLEILIERKDSGDFNSKNEQKLVEFLIEKFTGYDPVQYGKLFPSWVLLGAKEYQVRRRLGGGCQYKEVQWMGESFVVRHFFGEIDAINSEVSTLLSLSHPNILQYIFGFYEEERKEYFLVMELMNKDLSLYLKENSGPRRRVLFSISVIVDIMLQIARGMQYLHARKIYHGDLNPFNIFLKSKSSTEGYFQSKISGFGLSDIKTPSRNSSNQNETEPFIWYAPEVLAEQEEQSGRKSTFKYTEKADVYSFGMVCFQLLTGKVPFEDGHLQGEKMGRNIQTGERPLFPYPSPKYLVNLTKRCWHTDPSQRPSFSSICRILRYIKKFLAVSPENNQPELNSPPIDYCDIEAALGKKFLVSESVSVSQIPFEMFAYKVAEMEKLSNSIRDKSPDSLIDTGSICKEDSVSVLEDGLVSAGKDPGSLCSDVVPVKKIVTGNKKSSNESKGRKINLGAPKTYVLSPSRSTPTIRNTTAKIRRENSLMVIPSSSSSHSRKKTLTRLVTDSDLQP